MKEAIIAASGRGFVQEYETACARMPKADTFGVNYTSLFLPKAKFLVSLHSHELGPLRALWTMRDWARQGKAPLPTTIGPAEVAGVDLAWKPEAGVRGTSALYAVRAALHLGYERVLLAGVPLDGAGRFYDDFIPGRTATVWPHEVDRPPWIDAFNKEFEGRVRSLSGWTAELLGSTW